MANSQDRSVSIVDAARLIFRTSAPSDKQVRRVYELMKVGAIRVRDYGGPPLRWTTTEGALADFLASQRESRAIVKRASHLLAKPTATLESALTPAARHDDDEATENLRDVYRGIWRDYFLAVMLRRRMSHRTQAFARCVVAGQVILLLALIGVFTGVCRMAVSAKPAEHTAIERWIEANTDDYKIKRWFPIEADADGGGTVVQVQYCYQKDSRRWIHTDRRFQVLGEGVTELPGE